MIELTESEQALILQKALRSQARAERKEFRKKVLALELKDGMVFQSTAMDYEQKHRRIIHAANGYCIYSDGGDINKECQIKTMRNWIIYRKAKWDEKTAEKTEAEVLPSIPEAYPGDSRFSP